MTSILCIDVVKFNLLKQSPDILSEEALILGKKEKKLCNVTKHNFSNKQNLLNTSQILAFEMSPHSEKKKA